MKTWSYTAYTPQGRRHRGVLVAEDAARVAAQLEARGLLAGDIVLQPPPRARAALFTRTRRIDRDMLSVFTRQMAVLLEAGLAADAALDAVQTSAASPAIESFTARTRARLMDGAPLADAMEGAGSALPPFFTAAVRAGEGAGNLAQVFATLADHLENASGARAQLAAALLYPLFVTAVAVLVCSVLMVTVVPEIVTMVQASGQELPGLTVALLRVTDAVGVHWPSLLAALAGLAGLAAASGRVAALRHRRDGLVLRLPLLGRFLRMAEAAQYLRTLALVINSRLPLTDALDHAAAVLEVQRFRTQATEAATALRRGENLASALAGLDFLHPVARQLLQAGEASARLGPMSDRAAVLVETWSRSARKRAAALVEPIAMVIVGGVVLVIVLAVLLPIFDMQAVVGT